MLLNGLLPVSCLLASLALRITTVQTSLVTAMHPVWDQRWMHEYAVYTRTQVRMCINKSPFQVLESSPCHWRERLSVTNLSLENNLPTFGLNAPVVIREKVKRCEQMFLFIAMHYCGYMSLEVKGWWGLFLPPCLITVIQLSGTSSPPSWLKRSSESIIWMCRASFNNSSCPLPWSRTVVSSSRLDSG